MLIDICEQWKISICPGFISRDGDQGPDQIITTTSRMIDAIATGITRIREIDTIPTMIGHEVRQVTTIVMIPTVETTETGHRIMTGKILTKLYI